MNDKIETLKIIRVALEKVRKKEEALDLRDDFNLLESGLLDSLDALVFLMEIETNTNVKFPEKELEGEESLYIVRNLINYIQKNQ